MKKFLYIILIFAGFLISSAMNAQTISGPNIVCAGSSTKFTASSFPNGYYWGKSTNLNIASSSGDDVYITPNGSGSAWVALYDGNSPNAKATKYVWIGAPSLKLTGDNSIPPWSGTTFYSSQSDNSVSMDITSYQWQIVPSPSSMTSYGTYASAYFTVEDTYRVSVRATNSCGTGSWADHYITVGNRSAAYPHPATDVLNVEVGRFASERAQNLPYDIRLYSAMGIQLRQIGNRGSGTVQIDVSSLPNGTYHLHINDGVNKEPDVHKIIVKH